MSTNNKNLANFLKALFDPNANDAQINQVITSMIQLEEHSGLPAKEQRPKNKKEVCALLAQQSVETSLDELEHYLDHYYRSIEVAKLVARHPNINLPWLVRFMNYLPTDAQANPKYQEFKQHEDWEKLLAEKPKKAEPSYISFRQLRRYTVDSETPHAFKVMYWLENGSPADIRYLAGLNKVEEKLVLPFAKDKSSHVRKALAKRWKISNELAAILVNDKAKTIRQALADNRHCPADILTVLSQDAEETVKQAALSNKACPADAIHAAKLAAQMQPKLTDKPIDDLNMVEVLKLLGDPNTTPEVLQSLSVSPENTIRAGVALHRNCSAALLSSLAQDQVRMIKLSVAFNPNTDTKVLQKILQEGDTYYHVGLASNPSLSEKQQLDLVKIATDEIRLILAETTESKAVWCALRDSVPNKKTPKKAKKKTWRECLELCLDPNAKGLYALQRSCDYRYHFVNKLVARHPKCPESLKKHYAFYSFSSLAQNPKVALQLLENPNAIKAVEYAEWKLNDWMMYNEAPGHVVKYYLQHNNVQLARKSVVCWTAQIVDIQPHVFDQDIHIKKHIAGLKNCTQFMFEILARDAKESVRAAVVSNPNCPTEVLLHLHNDKVASIRISVQSHRNFKASSLKESGKAPKIESLKNKGPKRNRIKQAKDTKSLTVLRDLAGDKLAEVRLSVINNDRCPTDVLELFKADENAEIRRLSTNHRNSNFEICRHLFEDAEEKVRFQALNAYIRGTAKRPDHLQGKHDDFRIREYDEVVLEQFKDDSYERIRGLVARLTEDTQKQLVYSKDASKHVRELLATNYNLGQAVALELVTQGESAVVRRLAENTIDPKVLVATLDHDKAVASSLWRNRLMMENSAVLQVMVKHNSAEIRNVAATHVKDIKSVDRLVKDIDLKVLASLSYRSGLTNRQIEQLLEKANEEVLSGLFISNGKYFRKNVSALVKHENIQVRACVAENVNMPKELVAALLKDESVLVRRKLASSYENTLNNASIEQLRSDPDKSVRQAIKWQYD